MPTYVYKFVETGETIEIQQSFSDDTLTEAVHPDTGETLPVKKVFQPVGVTFKGDGFYKTDSRSGKSATKPAPSSDASPSSTSDSAASSSGASSGSSSDASSTPKKSESSTTSSSSSSSGSGS